MIDCQSCNENPGDKLMNHFLCPNDGVVHQEFVIFLCNICKREELINIRGMYVCPAFFEDKEPLQCLLCDSRKVEYLD